MLDFEVATPKKKSKKAEAPAPAARDPFDITPIRDTLKKYEAEVATMKQTAELHQVIDEPTNVAGIEMASQAKRLSKTIEDMRVEKVKPYQQYVKAINNLSKVYTDNLDAIERGLKHKIGGYLTKMKLEKLEAERRAQEAAAELQRKLDKESKELNLPQVQVPIPVLNQKAEPVRTEEGSASQTKRWKARLVDINLVPREYMLIDMPKVNQFVRAGGRVLDGFVIEQEESVNIRL